MTTSVPPEFQVVASDAVMKHRSARWVAKSWCFVVAAAGILWAQSLLAQSPSFHFLNERPAKEDRPRFLSTSAWSCAFGIWVLSDEGRAFDRVTKLEAELRMQLGAKLDGHTLRLKSYQVYFNEAVYRSDVVDSVVAGSVGAVTTGQRRVAAKCSQQETPDGWFSPAELSNNHAPFVVEIEAMLDATPLSVRSVYSPSISLTVPPTLLSSKVRKNFADEAAGPEVERAMSKANADFIEQIARLL